MSKARFWCAFCGDRAGFSFDYVPMCAWHGALMTWALTLDWHD